MALGLSTQLANDLLNTLRNVSYAEAGVYVKLHTGDPGSAGTANASAETTRKAITLSAASGGSAALSASVSWTSWPAGTETISHFSIHDAASAGTFLWSGALSASKTVYAGDTLTLSTLTASFSTLAA